MAGNAGHGDLSRFFPDAESAECLANGKWAAVVRRDERGSFQTSPECPLCAKDRMSAAIQRFVPPRFHAPIAVPAAVTAWAERGTKAEGLYLTGQVGTGKTHAAWIAVAAWCMVTETVPRSEPAEGPWGVSRPNVIFTRMTDLLDDLRPGDDSRQRIRDCQRAALLVIDDVGAEKPSEWTQERFYSVIDDRYAARRPLIVTSNLPPKKLGPQVGERSASRLAEMCGDVVPMTGSDRRKPSE